MRLLHPIRTWRSMRRRSKVITGLISGFVLVPAVAIAAFFSFNLGVGGSVKAGSFSYTLGSTSLFSPGPAGQADVCGGVTNTTSALTIAPGTGGLPGDSCQIHVPITADGNSTNGVIAGLVIPGLPKGWTASLTMNTGGADACGTTVTPTSTVQTVLTIGVDPNGTTGTFAGGTFNLGAGQIEVAPAAQAPASPVCSITGTQ